MPKSCHLQDQASSVFLVEIVLCPPLGEQLVPSSSPAV
ncbi:hypothetical protein PCLA_07r0117 [Pseudomonas citronellolis]|nr:hypothetical protein PCLA_07r0117 [Pseudomonas citronellolis]